MPYIIERTTLADIKTTNPKTIWYSVKTCWWTHRSNDLYLLSNGIPCDPRGGVLMMTDAKSFIKNAENNPDFYGKHGIKAFIAAHHDNCIMSQNDIRSTCFQTWQSYNDLIDQIDAKFIDIDQINAKFIDNNGEM